MGWNDHIDWDFLQALEEAVERGLLDEEADADIIALGKRKAEGEQLTDAELATVDARLDEILEALDEEHDQEHLEYLLSKDD
jgi:hypothetical protein